MRASSQTTFLTMEKPCVQTITVLLPSKQGFEKPSNLCHLPKGRRHYPARLSKHIRKRSKNKDDPMLMYLEWTTAGQENIGDKELWCPCGKQGTQNIVHIADEKIGKATHVSTTCAQWFDEDMKEALKFTHGLDYLKMKGHFFGTFDNGVMIKHKFRVDENESLARKAEFLRLHMDYVPVYDQGVGQIQVLFPRKPDLEQGRYYLLCWRAPHGTSPTELALLSG